MSFIQQSDLISDSKLSPSSYYTEPRDLHNIYVLRSETLAQFTTRVVNYRKSKGYPPLNPNELRLLVVASLERTTPKKDMGRYFVTKAVLPQFSQIAQLAKVIVTQAGKRSVSYNTRQDRVDKCLSCKLHKSNNSIGNFAAATITKALDLVSDTSQDTLAALQVSDRERALGTCGMCGCGLSNKVRIDVMGALASLHPGQLDMIIRIYGIKAFESCWVLNESVKDGNTRQLLVNKLKRTRTNGAALLKEYITSMHLKAVKGNPNEQ